MRYFIDDLKIRMAPREELQARGLILFKKRLNFRCFSFATISN